jgi:hypothetical protein
MNIKHRKGINSQLIAQAYFSSKPNTLVFTPVSGVGPVDIVVLNTKTNEYTNYDVKTVSYRKSDTKYAHKKNDRINRSPSKLQQGMNVKIVYVYEDGKVVVK